ncbi:MAG: T9SS type A sorting domain-containing protein [Muribaculaceae bacterium]|jgi:hypothetical protein|nr:T9SS type A sorting domain-containing protein [Muribaculaceae bacterium]
MHKSLLLLSLLLASQFAGAEGYKTISVITKNGNTTAVDIAEQTQIKFSGTQITFGDKTFNRADVVKFSYVKGSGTVAIKTGAERPFRQVGNSLIFSTDANAAIFAVDGRKVISDKVEAGSSISIASLATGVYIIKVNNETFKIAKR